MTVTLSVREIRDALYLADRASPTRGPGVRVPSMMGTWFHGWMHEILSDMTPEGVLPQLSGVADELELWKKTLRDETYRRLVGPKLTREQSLLHEHAPEVMTLWRATEAVCDWIAELLWAARPRPISRNQLPHRPWQTSASWFQTEDGLQSEWHFPGWREPVRVIGIPDAVLRLEETGAWCAIEFKLGQTSPAVDLGQACLYHMMLSQLRGADAEGGPGTLALISFRPERHEQLFTEDQLASARERLLDLIGRLAGVVDDEPSQSPVPVKKKADTTDATEQADARALSDAIIETLAEYGVNVTVEEPPIVGPTFIRVPITPGRGVTVRKVEKYPAEIQVRLGLPVEPIINRDEHGISIDIQRPDRQSVPFERYEDLFTGGKYGSGSSVPIAVDLQDELVCADLNQPENSHLLVAGCTGSGKSEWLRTAIAGLLLANTPATLRLVLIDPKRNAFIALKDSPFLWRPLVFPDEHSVVEVLDDLIEEMERRYRLMGGLDHFSMVADRGGDPLPRIVCICDEYRDLISRDKKERQLIEQRIFRLGAKARAAGIHLILATQEPSRDTISGVLDSNIPARVGLTMAKAIESRMLVNEAGAEKLLGHGDLLFRDVGVTRRLQAPLLSEERRNALFGGNGG